MADQPDEQPLSKRERQKQRRHAKREAAQAAKRRNRMRRTISVAVVIALVVVAAGVGVWQWQEARGERQTLLTAEADEAEDAGCQPQEEPEFLGAEHFGGDPAEIEAEPPEVLYDHRPATSGKHLGLVAATGVYDQYVDERLTLHNLEHGYVIAWWDPELPEEEVAEIQEWAEGAMGDANDHLIAAPYSEPLPDGGSVALVTWQHRQLCDTFSPEVADAFIAEHADNAYSEHPPADAHDGSADGELVPGEDAVIFPPFEDAEAAVPGAPPTLDDADDADDDEEAEGDADDDG